MIKLASKGNDCRLVAVCLRRLLITKTSFDRDLFMVCVLRLAAAAYMRRSVLCAETRELDLDLGSTEEWVAL
jgi:hypothetical protein